MPTDRTNNNLRQDENTGNDESSVPDENREQFESDTQRIIRRHLENKDDVITEDDIRNVRIGMAPEFDEATESRFEDDDSKEAVEEEYLGADEDREEEATEEDRITPWDTIDND